MRTLKTLRDMQLVWVTDEAGTGAGHYQRSPVGIFATIDELRIEAIKHIKDLEIETPFPTIEHSAKIEWIKHFFNITDEELSKEVLGE